MKIAIIGMAFRFPGDIHSEARFWEALRNAEDLVTTIDSTRWGTEFYQHPRRSEPGRSITFAAGQLSRIDEFDAQFFGISPREARQMDPQQRMLLELAWEALEDGGQLPERLAGSDCGVYIGISGLDYGGRVGDDISAIDAYFMTGNTLSIAANRLSYVFDLRGPSMAIDTACSSSLVALHQACQSLRNGESGMAIAGGAHLLMHPYPFVGFTKASMLSAGGRCRTFDAEGDGYVRAEGGAVLILKPLEAALADGDHVHAVILASGVNADGNKSGLTIPSSAAQAELMRACCDRAGVAPDDIAYIEAHGTGTAVGDPIETAAIGAAIGQARSTPLYVGSVKSNLGHLEPASGMAGLVKTVLCLKERILPPSLHLKTPNPHIDFEALNLLPVTELTPLADTAAPLCMGVNSFGFGGANAHVLLEDAPPACRPQARAATPPLFLSARHPEALKALAGRHADLIGDGMAYYDVAHAAAHRRQRLDLGLAITGTDPAEVARLLRQCASGDTPRGCVRENRIGAPARVAFVYSGNGAQWLGMGRRLFAGDTVFRTTVEEIDTLLARHGDLSVAAELRAEPGVSRLHLTEVAQPALFAVQVGVTRMLRARGLEAEATLGHSVGEVAAAWAMGALSLEQAVLVIHERSAAQAETQGAGRMAAVGLAAAEAEQAIAEAGLTAELAFAAYNSPGAVTLSGSLAALESLQARLAPRGVFFRLLDLDYAFHSWHMDGLKPRILRDLANLAPTRGTGRFISTVAGTETPGDQLDAAYWWRNIREPVQFAMAVNHLAEQGFQVFVEIGPHAIMQRYIADCLAAADRVGRVLATLKRDDDDADRIDETVCRAHLLGAEVDMKAWFPAPARHVSLPGYPWQRERYWHASTSEGYALFDRVRSHPLLGYRLKDAEASWENQLDPELLPWLRDHVVGGAMVLPAAAYAELALAASARQYGGSRHDVEELEIRLPIVLEAEVARTLRFELDPRDGTFRITSRPRLSDEAWSVHAVGRLLGPALAEIPTPEPLADLGAPALTAARHYRLCRDMGLDYGPAFQGMQAAWLDGDDLITRIELPKASGDDALMLHPALADACFQSLLGLCQDDEQRQTTYLPVRIGRLRLYRAGSRPSHCRTRMLRRGPHSLLAEFTLFDADGHAVARLEDCRFRAAQLAAQTRTAEWVNCAELKPRQVPDSPLATSPVLARHVRAQLDLDANHLRRQHHFTEAMPLLDALIGVFARRALAAATPTAPPQPYQDWLLGVAVEDGLAERTDDGWHLTETTPTAAEDIWLTILADNPAYLPELAIAGRIGNHLAEILAGQLDGQDLVAKLREGPLFEQLHEASPTFRAMNRGLRALLKQIVRDWPANRRLRILDLAPPCLPLVDQLLACLPADRCDYVIATDAGTRARAEAEFGHLDGFACVELDRADWMLGDPALPVFDVILANHALHQAQAPVQVLANLKRHLARTGLLVIMERHPDRFATFIHGLHPDWWRPGGATLAEAETWYQHLAEAGYTDIETLCETQANPIHPGIGLLLARNPDLPETVARTTVATRWLLLASPAAWPFAEAVGGHLRNRGHTVDISATGPLEPGRHDHVALFPDADQGAESEPMAAQAGCLAALDLVQALAEAPGHKPRLWLLSAGGAGATSADGRRVFGRPNPSEATRWGFARVVANEHPDLDCTRIDLQAPADLALAARLAEELLDPDGEDEIILGPDSRHVSRMRRAEPARRSESSFANVRLGFTLPGRLKNLEWQEHPLAEPGEGEIEIQPRAAGLNFRDVMYAMGLLSDEAVENGFAGPSMGMELAGIVSRVGAGVNEFKPGDAVIAFAPSGFARRAVTRATAAVAKPEHWSFEEAATVPTVFFTVYYALHHLARLQPGEKVLIHGAAGGVGIAAIQLARHLGAEIFATAGSDEKRDFVRMLGADHVMNSRSLAYADEIMDLTGGCGVDVVINSLAGEAINRNLRVLRPFGRFLELGKRDYYENTHIGLRPFKDNISYFGIDADQLMVERPELTARLFREMMDLFRDGVLHPLPHRVFPAARIVDAFRYMQQAKQIGKVVVDFQDQDLPVPAAPAQPPRLHGEATYLVAGGLGGFGLRTACWLAERGAGHIVLLGRRGPDSPDAAAAVAAVRAAGAEARVMACDIADANRLQAVLGEIQRTLPPLKGIVHAAMVLDDGLIRNLDHERFLRVLGPKVAGSWNLHRLTRHLPLDLFVLYSSATTLIGNPGQANYVAANAYLEALAAYRRGLGLPATAVCWGAIADVGYLAQNQAVRDSLEAHLGAAALDSGQALARLGELLADQRNGIAVFDFDWHALSRFLPATRAARFDAVRRRAGSAGAAAENEDIRALIGQLDEASARALVERLVTAEIADILRLPPERVPADRSLYDIGMDSLMGVELVLGIEKRFGINLPTMALSEGPTIQRIAARLLQELHGHADPEPSADARLKDMMADMARQHDLEVDESELDTALADLRAHQATGVAP